MVKILIVTGQFDTIHFRPKTRQLGNELAREGFIDTAIAGNGENDITDIFLNSAAQELNPKALTQLNERRGVKGEQRLDRVEYKMIVKNAITVCSCESVGNGELANAGQTTEDDDAHTAVCAA